MLVTPLKLVRGMQHTEGCYAKVWEREVQPQLLAASAATLILFLYSVLR